MDERKKKILCAVIESYVSTAEPVGSNTLAQRGEFPLSPATLRHEMAELESMGYLEHPHTSAGRVPSSMGYRLYVDELMRTHRLTHEEMEIINNGIRRRIQELDKLIIEAGKLVSRLTQYTAYTIAPHVGSLRFLRYDLLSVDPGSYAVILITDVQIVRNKIVRRPYEPDGLRPLADAMNIHWRGLAQADITPELERAVLASVPHMSDCARQVLLFMREVTDEMVSRDVYVSGEAHMLAHPEYSDSAKARRMLSFLAEESGVLPSAQGGNNNGVKVVIGSENMVEQLRDCSCVMSTYELSGGLRGVIGLIGPTRMDYARLTSKLEYFAGQLGRLLCDDERSEYNG